MTRPNHGMPVLSVWEQDGSRRFLPGRRRPWRSRSSRSRPVRTGTRTRRAQDDRKPGQATTPARPAKNGPIAIGLVTRFPRSPGVPLIRAYGWADETRMEQHVDRSAIRKAPRIEQRQVPLRVLDSRRAGQPDSKPRVSEGRLTPGNSRRRKACQQDSARPRCTEPLPG